MTHVALGGKPFSRLFELLGLVAPRAEKASPDPSSNQPRVAEENRATLELLEQRAADIRRRQAEYDNRFNHKGYALIEYTGEVEIRAPLSSTLMSE